ncbi:MAG: RNA polymerase sigma factor [Pseudomonadota bacterium]
MTVWRLVDIDSGVNTLTSTTRLLGHIADGDDQAREILLARYLPRLQAWAHGRLPPHQRDLAETDDLVQITMLRALNKLQDFEARKPGAFLAYLRTILLNVLRDEVRRGKRRPVSLSMSLSELTADSSTVEQLVGIETLEAYERALLRLPEEKRLAVIMRVEFGMSYQEIAEELERDSANGTRMLVVRAIEELAEAMET